MFNFEYYTPTKVIFGRNSENKLVELLQEYGAHKVLIHYGGKSALKSGLINKIKTALDNSEIRRCSTQSTFIKSKRRY